MGTPSEEKPVLEAETSAEGKEETPVEGKFSLKTGTPSEKNPVLEAETSAEGKRERSGKSGRRVSISKRQKKLMLIFGLFILVIIPVYSVLLATKADIFSVSLSSIAYELGYYRMFFLWAALISVFYLIFLGYLFSIARFENKKAVTIYVVGCVLVFLTVVFPYLPEVFPILTKLHNVVGMGSAVLLLISIFYFVFFLADKDKRVYTLSMIALISIVLICALLYFFLGINSLLEIFFVVATGIFLLFLCLWIRRTPEMDADANYKAALLEHLRKKQEFFRKQEEEVSRQIQELLNEPEEPSAPAAASHKRKARPQKRTKSPPKNRD